MSRDRDHGPRSASTYHAAFLREWEGSPHATAWAFVEVVYLSRKDTRPSHGREERRS